MFFFRFQKEQAHFPDVRSQIYPVPPFLSLTQILLDTILIGVRVLLWGEEESDVGLGPPLEQELFLETQSNI